MLIAPFVLLSLLLVAVVYKHCIIEMPSYIHTDAKFLVFSVFICLSFSILSRVVLLFSSQSFSPIVSVPFHSRLCSADNNNMIVARTQTARYGLRNFCIAAPQIWNTLLPHLKNSDVSRKHFKSSLNIGSLCKPTHKSRL